MQCEGMYPCCLYSDETPQDVLDEMQRKKDFERKNAQSWDKVWRDLLLDYEGAWSWMVIFLSDLGHILNRVILMLAMTQFLHDIYLFCVNLFFLTSVFLCCTTLVLFLDVIGCCRFEYLTCLRFWLCLSYFSWFIICNSFSNPLEPLITNDRNVGKLYHHFLYSRILHIIIERQDISPVLVPFLYSINSVDKCRPHLDSNRFLIILYSSK